MREQKSLTLRKYSQFSAMIWAALTFTGLSQEANALTADDVLNKMTPAEQHAFISGVVGGLAYARFLSERPDESGMSCIYDWYHTGGEAKHKQINQWFERHADKPAEPLLYVLIKRECGE